MNRNDKIIMIILFALVGILAITYVLNQEDIESKKALNREAIFEVYYQEAVVASYNMEEIADMGAVTFTANLKSSGNDPEAHEYTGVLLKTIFQSAGLDLEDKSSATVMAVDGYAAALTMEKLLADDNAYLAYMRDGDLLGTKESGGSGPYQLVISQDKFSQYWVKYAYRGELKD